jgi:hypothetical protein
VRARGLAVVPAAALLLAGCSSGGSSGSANADAMLQSDVLTLTQAAAARNWPAAQAAMDQLRADLAAAVSAGRISAARAATIRSHLSAVATDVASRTAPSTTSSTPTPKPKPQPKPPKHGKHGHGGDDNRGGEGD